MFLEIWQLFLAPENKIFSIFLCTCFFILILEVVGLIFGFTSDALDGVIPDFLKIDFEATDGALATPANWLSLGKIPLLIWLVIFFGGWGVTGLVLQQTMDDFFGAYFMPIIAIPIAFAINLFVVHFVCRLIKPLFHDRFNNALSIEEFIGIEAEIVLGTAKKGSPAQARLFDRNGKPHYIMIEPISDDLQYNEGEKIIVAEIKDDCYLGLSPKELTLK